MGREVLITLLLIHASWGGEVYDVTTIYNLRGDQPDSESQLEISGRVHVRTNALGLPLNGNFSGTDHSIRDIKCDFSDWTCNWQGWNTEFIDKSITSGKAYKLPKSPSPLKLGINTNKNSYEEGGIRYHSWRLVTKYYRPAYIYFTHDSTTLGNNNYPQYVLEINPSSHTYPNFYKCTPNFYSYYYNIERFVVKNRNNEDFHIVCERHSTASLEISEYPAYLSFSFHNDYIRIKEKRSSSFSSLMDRQDINRIKYFSMSGEFLDHMGASIKIPVYSSKNPVDELISPTFNLKSEKVSIILSVHSATEVKSDLLKIIVKRVDSDEREFNQIVSDFQEGWNRKIVQIDLTNNTWGIFRIKIKTTKSTTVKINYIECMNFEGDQYIHELTNIQVAKQNLNKLRDNSDTPLLPIYYADVSLVTQDSEDMTNLILSKNDSSCLPGFTGTNCQNGCGSNRFGHDCGGLCSLRDTECSGLLLCTFDKGCSCAPGYRGTLCHEKCPNGMFGNDCLQQCGRCADGICDIYTGECTSCELGYHPPHCTRAYVYYAKKPTLTAINYGKIQTTFLPTDSIQGTAELYQVQYRKKGGEWETHSTKSVNVGNSTNDLTKTETIEDLEAGEEYEVKVLLMDSDFNKYDGNLVQLSKIRTTCKIPEKVDYNIDVVRTSSSLQFSWSYKNTSAHWCPLVSYEVSWKEDWKWYSKTVTENSIMLSDLLPGAKIEFKVRATTVTGQAPSSKTILAITKRQGISRVRDLRVVKTDRASAKIAWVAPLLCDDHDVYYVSYGCEEQPACKPGCVDAAPRTDTVRGHNATSLTLTLGDLKPFARYRVSVSQSLGPSTTLYFGTSKSVPVETPLLSASKTVQGTNTSLTVFWDPVPVCTGFMLGYNYQLIKESEPSVVINEGFTTQTNASFLDLSASTAYVVKVFIVNVAGWNPEAHLDIKAITSATVPNAVRNLTVYKSGRGSAGLRWAAPDVSYGPLKSFTVSHTPVSAGDGEPEASRVVEPTHCKAWPDLYCHTVEGLKANRAYNIYVSARNTEVAEDGARVQARAFTKEGPPSAPQSLRLSNSTESSVGLMWEHPDIANGQLRSFVVSIEETERFDQAACCEVYPLFETPVESEDRTYEAEVSGLQPAATYYVSVSAKTVGLGPAQSLVAHTRPPSLPVPLNALPSLDNVLVDKELSWISQDPSPKNKTLEIYQPLIKSRLLLAVVNVTVETGSGLSNSQLNSLLRQKVDAPFLFISEFKEGDSATTLLWNEDPPVSEWGSRPSSLSLPGDSGETPFVRLVAAQITEYGGIYNADLVLSTPSDVPEEAETEANYAVTTKTLFSSDSSTK